MSKTRERCDKFANTDKPSSPITVSSKIARAKVLDADYTKASTLAEWLFLKYGMSYKAYRRKSRDRRLMLKEEYVEDTEADIRTPEERDYDDAMQILSDCGVPFAPDGTPLGIGWDD